MSNRYNFFYFEAEFKKYLIAGNAEASTIKNYLSDLHFFFSWVQNAQQIVDLAYSDIPDVFSHSLIREYHEYLKSSTTSENTVVRRLATLRKFFQLCADQRWLVANPTDEYDKRTKQDEIQEVVFLYKKNLMDKGMVLEEIDRQIKIVRDLITNSSIL